MIETTCIEPVPEDQIPFVSGIASDRLELRLCLEPWINLDYCRIKHKKLGKYLDAAKINKLVIDTYDGMEYITNAPTFDTGFVH